jgi:hypothetical protein
VAARDNGAYGRDAEVRKTSTVLDGRELNLINKCTSYLNTLLNTSSVLLVVLCTVRLKLAGDQLASVMLPSHNNSLLEEGIPPAYASALYHHAAHATLFRRCNSTLISRLAWL